MLTTQWKLCKLSALCWKNSNWFCGDEWIFVFISKFLVHSYQFEPLRKMRMHKIRSPRILNHSLMIQPASTLLKYYLYYFSFEKESDFILQYTLRYTLKGHVCFSIGHFRVLRCTCLFFVINSFRHRHYRFIIVSVNKQISYTKWNLHTCLQVVDVRRFLQEWGISCSIHGKYHLGRLCKRAHETWNNFGIH